MQIRARFAKIHEKLEKFLNSMFEKYVSWKSHGIQNTLQSSKKNYQSEILIILLNYDNEMELCV